MTGAEFKAWLASDWSRPNRASDDPMWDDVWVTVDGNGTDDPVISTIADDAAIVVEHGIIVFDQNRLDSDTMHASAHIRAWRKKRSEKTIVITVPVDRAPVVEEMLREAGVSFR